MIYNVSPIPSYSFFKETCLILNLLAFLLLPDVRRSFIEELYFESFYLFNWITAMYCTAGDEEVLQLLVLHKNVKQIDIIMEKKNMCTPETTDRPKYCEVEVPPTYTHFKALRRRILTIAKD